MTASVEQKVTMENSQNQFTPTKEARKLESALHCKKIKECQLKGMCGKEFKGRGVKMVFYACTSVSNLPEHANKQSGNSYPLHSCKLALISGDELINQSV